MIWSMDLHWKMSNDQVQWFDQWFALKLEIVLFRYKIIKMMFLFYIIIIIVKKSKLFQIIKRGLIFFFEQGLYKVRDDPVSKYLSCHCKIKNLYYIQWKGVKFYL